MEQIKIGKLFEDDTTSINQVAVSLHAVGIELMQDANTFRPMGDVLTDLAGKWDTLNQKQQNAIAGTIAGIRQVPQFLTLMQNWAMVTKAEGIELDSAGLATQRYKIYLQGLEATANKFTSTWQELWMKTFNSDTVKTIINAGTALLQMTGNIGGLIPVVATLAGVLILLNFGRVAAAIQSISLVVPSAISALTALTATATGTALAIGVATAGLSLLAGGIVYAVYSYNQSANSAEHYTEKLNELTTAVSDLNTKLSTSRDALSNLKDLSDEFDKLRNNTSKSTDEQKRWTDIQNQLKTIMPEVNGYYDAQGNFILDNTVNLKDLIVQKQKELDLDRQLLELKKGEETEAAGKTYELEKQKLDNMAEAQKALETPHKISWLSAGAVDYYSLGIEKLNGLVAEQAIIVQQAKLKYDELSFSMKGAFESGAPDSVRRLAQHLNTMDEALKKAQELLQNFDLSKLTAQDDSLLKIMDDMQKNGEITISQVEELQKAYPEDYLKFITMEGNQYKLNTEALKKYMAAEVEQIILALQLTDATSALIPILKTYEQQLLSGGVTAQEKEKAYQDLLKDTIDMIKQEKEAEKQALQEQLDAYKSTIDAEKQLIDDRATKEKQHLQDQLDGYKKIIDAEKALIDAKQKEADFQDQVAGKNKEIATIDNQLLALQFDNSEEAKAKRLQLEADKVAKVKELSKIENDNSISNQKSALDKEYTAFEDKNKKQQTAIERTAKAQKALLDKEYKDFESNIKSKQKALDDYLKQTGKMNADAMALLDKRTDIFYQKLLAWNKQYGTSIQTDVTDKWKAAFDTMQGLSGAMPSWAVTGPYSGANKPPGTTLPSHHSGGVVGGMPKLAESEVFAKLVRGEIVVTEGQASSFLQNTLPKLFDRNNKGNGDINASIEINVAGNLDREIIPNIKEVILETLNTAMKNRGIRRDTFSYSL